MGLNLTLNANVSHVTNIRKVLVIPRVRKVVRGNEDKNFIFKFSFIPKLLNTDPPPTKLSRQGTYMHLRFVVSLRLTSVNLVTTAYSPAEFSQQFQTKPNPDTRHKRLQ